MLAAVQALALLSPDANNEICVLGAGNGGLRELHSGKAYPIELRHRVLNDVQFSSSAEVAAKYRISKRTVNRWRKRLATTDCAHRTPCHRPDPTILTPEVLEFIGWLLTLNPRFTNAALAEHVYEAFHVYLPHSTVSKALAHLRVTTKKAVKRAAQRNLEERVQWWTNPPFVSADQDRLLCRPGVAGLHASALVDVDETGIVVTDCIGQYARFFMGSRAEIDTLYPVSTRHAVVYAARVASLRAHTESAWAQTYAGAGCGHAGRGGGVDAVRRQLRQ